MLLCCGKLVMTRFFCGSLLAAPVLTDTRRSTVGPGTHENRDAVPLSQWPQLLLQW